LSYDGNLLREPPQNKKSTSFTLRKSAGCGSSGSRFDFFFAIRERGFVPDACLSNQEGYASKVLFFYATRLFTSINSFRCSGEAVRRLRADDRVFISLKDGA
jgi:hypothetical protein